MRLFLLLMAWGLAGCSFLGVAPPPVPQTAVPAVPAPARMVIAAGETVEQAFERLGKIDNSIYIVTQGGNLVLKGTSAPMANLADMTAYLNAYGFEVAVSIRETPYMRVAVTGRHVGVPECAPLAATIITPMVLKDRPFADVMDALLAGTHYRWSARTSLPKIRISAGNVSGSLATLLPQLLDETRTPYAVKECEVVIGN